MKAGEKRAHSPEQSAAASKRPTSSFQNDSGEQFNALGGPQNTAIGNGTNCPGSTFNGPTYFSGTSPQPSCVEYFAGVDPSDIKRSIHQTRGNPLKESYGWILEHPQFQQWRDDEDGRLLWIKGDPGKGKTMLLCGIINELEPSTRLAGPGRTTLLSYFFCQATDTRFSNAQAVLRGLIHMVVNKQQLSLGSDAQSRFNDKGEARFADAEAWPALCNILASILRDPNLGKIYLIIDALDECINDRDKLLTFVLQETNLPRVKWIVSSRNHVEPRYMLESSQSILGLELKDNAEFVSRAIGAYIDNRTSRILCLQQDFQLRDHVRRVLREKADGTFLWVALVVQELERAKRRDVRRVVGDVPTGLNELYARMIKQIQQLEGLEAEYCRLVLSAAALAYRPLRLPELGVVSGLPDEISGEDEYILEVVETSGSFLTVRDKTIYFVHQSARDYLVDKAASTIFPSGPTAAHSIMFRQSLNSLCKSLRRDIYNLWHPGTLFNEVKMPVPDPLVAVRYSCLYWINHLFEARHRADFRDAVRDNGDVHDFLRRYLLYWIEALSLCGAISDGVLAVARLEKLLETTTPDSGLLSATKDVHRFLRYNGFIIRKAPLQIYKSALLFAPTGSLIRQLSVCQKEEPKWVSIRPAPHTDWSPLVQTLTGHEDSIYAVAFSPDGQLVASGSHDGTVILWHAGTGEIKQTLTGHKDWVNAVAFSPPDGQFVASASNDGTVKLWHAGTGEIKQTLTGHKNSVTAVAFSTDGQLVASASDDETVKLWHAGTGEIKQTLITGRNTWVSAVAFSPDGQFVASASDDQTVKLWHTGTGGKKETLTSHTSWVDAVAFSPDGQLLASASNDKTVKLWHTGTGEIKQTLTGHTFWVDAVAFSPDGQLVASASGDETVKLWHAGMGEIKQTLTGHKDSVKAVAFSPDGQLVASASYDKTIKLWYTGTGKIKQTLTGHIRMISAVTFSPDGQLVASASNDGTVKLWHASTGEIKQTRMTGQAFAVKAVAVSPDGQLVASASIDRTIELWHAGTGILLQTLPGSDLIRTIEFDDSITSLFTNIGRISLSTAAPAAAQNSDVADAVPGAGAATKRREQPLKQKPYGLDIDGSWITYDGKRVLWLPHEFQPWSSAAWGSVIAIGCTSGRVLLFRFSDVDTPLSFVS